MTEKSWFCLCYQLASRGCNFEAFLTTNGVSQGTVLGPLLSFNVYD